MPAPAKKSLFNTDFRAGPAREAEQIGKAALETAVAEAEARGYRAGYASAQADAAAEAQRRMTVAFEQIGATLATLVGGLSGIERRLEAEAVEVAVAVASKLATELV